MIQTIADVDELLAEANLPRYSEAMLALLALAREIGSIPSIDQHQVFKAWVILDRYSTNSLEH
jgi:thymidylate kinase